MQCYLSLKREFSVADFLTPATDIKLRTPLTNFRLSEHNLAIETDRYKQSWLPKEERFCQLCKRDVQCSCCLDSLELCQCLQLPSEC